jgi:hypothetical protein
MQAQTDIHEGRFVVDATDRGLTPARMIAQATASGGRSFSRAAIKPIIAMGRASHHTGLLERLAPACGCLRSAEDGAPAEDPRRREGLRLACLPLLGPP